MAIVRNITRTAGALVRSREARIAAIDKKEFMEISKSNPEFLFFLLRVCVDRIIKSEKRLDEVLRNGQNAIGSLNQP